MATRTGLIDRLRLEMADFTYAFQATFDGDGVTTRLDLPYDNISKATGFSVYYQSDPNTLLLETTDWTLDERNGWLVLAAAITDGDVLVVDGHYSELFSDTDLGTFIDTGFALHSHNTSLTYSTLPTVEDYLVVLVAKIEALWVMATDAAYDIDIRTVEGVSIPRSQRFAQLMALINGIQSKYDELASALNVGHGRIEMLTLRRVSRATGRYVPVYVQREVDDHNYPVRIFPPIDAPHVDPVVPQAGIHDIILDKGIPFSKTFTFNDANGDPINLASHTFSAQIRRDKFAGLDENTIEVEFAIDVSNAVNGEITISLTADETDEFGTNEIKSWDLQWLEPGATHEDTKLRGDVRVVAENWR